MEKVNEIENAKKKSSLRQKISKVWFVIFNFGYVVAYSIYTGYAIVNKHLQFEWLKYVLGAFILVYWGVLIATLVSGTKQKYKSIKKDYKRSFKIIKKVLKIVNLVLTITMVANTVINDKQNLFALILACVSIAYLVLQIIIEIVKFVRRKKKQKVKEEKAKLKQELVANIKNVISAENSNQNIENASDSLALTTDEDNNKTKNNIKIANKVNEMAEKTNNIVSCVKQYNVDKRSIGKKSKNK